MPITVQHQPPAAVIGRAAYGAGLGQMLRRREEQALEWANRQDMQREALQAQAQGRRETIAAQDRARFGSMAFQYQMAQERNRFGIEAEEREAERRAIELDRRQGLLVDAAERKERQTRRAQIIEAFPGLGPKFTRIDNERRRVKSDVTLRPEWRDMGLAELNRRENILLETEVPEKPSFAQILDERVHVDETTGDTFVRNPTAHGERIDYTAGKVEADVREAQEKKDALEIARLEHNAATHDKELAHALKIAALPGKKEETTLGLAEGKRQAEIAFRGRYRWAEGEAPPPLPPPPPVEQAGPPLPGWATRAQAFEEGGAGGSAPDPSTPPPADVGLAMTEAQTLRQQQAAQVAAEPAPDWASGRARRFASTEPLAVTDDVWLDDITREQEGYAERHPPDILNLVRGWWSAMVFTAPGENKKALKRVFDEVRAGKHPDLWDRANWNTLTDVQKAAVLRTLSVVSHGDGLSVWEAYNREWTGASLSRRVTPKKRRERRGFGPLSPMRTED